MTELTLPAFSVAPADAPASGPGVVVVHEGNGMSAQLLRFCERLAREGYRVIAPDFFSRSHGVDPTDFGAIIGSVTPEHLKGDFAAAIAALRERGASKIGVTGFCMGGWFTYRAAKWADDLGVDAAVPFYGGGIARDLGDVHCPTLLFFGDQRRRTSRWPTSRRCRRATATRSSCTPAPSTASCATARRTTTRRRQPTRGSRLLAFFGEHLS